MALTIQLLVSRAAFFGTATSETVAAASVTGSWHGDNANSVNSSNPWQKRGGQSNNGANAGAFAFYRHTGGVSLNSGYRTVLSGF